VTAHFYRIAKKVKPTGVGVTDSYYVELSAVAKNNGPNAPYCIPNEFIAGEIGRFLGLPIPPMGLMAVTGTSGPPDIWFASLDFNFTGVNLPPADRDACVKQLPSLSTGLIIFDTLLINCDRHRGNLSLDTSVTPHRLSVFDHSHALFGFTDGQGEQRLTDLRDKLGISGGVFTHGNRHCLLDKLDTFSHFQYWVDRIKCLPDFFIDDIFDRVENLGITATEITVGKDFIKHRRSNIVQILDAHQAEFKGITQWGALR